MMNQTIFFFILAYFNLFEYRYTNTIKYAFLMFILVKLCKIKKTNRTIVLRFPKEC